MKKPLKLLVLLSLAAGLFGGGFAVGWRWRERTPIVAPVTAEMTLDAKNRPATLKQFVIMPGGQRLEHGNQLKWDWEPGPNVGGPMIEGAEYYAGSQRQSGIWIGPSPTVPPEKPLEPTAFTKFPDE